MLAGKVAKGDPVLDAFGRHSWQNSQDTESQRKWHQRQCWGFDPLSQKHVLLLADMAKAVGGRVQGKRWNTQDWRCPETPQETCMLDGSRWKGRRWAQDYG